MIVSVLINNYNYEKYVASAIQSVLDQSYDDVEIILYDDNSTDSSIQVINEFKERIKVIHGDGKERSAMMSQANAIYQAFTSSQGEIVFLLDSDDMFYKNKIETVVKVFFQAGNEDVVLVQHNFDELDNTGRLIRENFKPLLPIKNQLAYIEFTRRLDFLFMQTSALAFRRSYLKKVLPFSSDIYNLIWSDVRLTRLSLNFGRTITIQNSLGLYRRHSMNDSNRLKKKNILSEFQTQHYAWFNAQKISSKIIHQPTAKISKLISLIRLLVYLFSFEHILLKQRVLFVRQLIKDKFL